MASKLIKPLLVAAFILNLLFFNANTFGQNNDIKSNAVKEEKLDAGEIILDHVMDAHEFHLLTIPNKENPAEAKHITIPLPVILYSKEKGFTCFMSSAFHHGEKTHNGFQLLTGNFMKEHGLDTIKNGSDKVFGAGKIYAINTAGMPDATNKVYDLSLTRNATQMIIGLVILLFLLLSIAKKYKNGNGVNTAPKGWQNALEPVITFVRDDIAKPNLGAKYKAYLPFLLTVFFFILINNIFGLIPGAANVTGNIAFTFILGITSFFIIMFSTNKHYWSHIFWPPVPHGVKPILVPVEILGIFTKPFALIIRLFANMLAGHIIILSFICLIFIMAGMKQGLGWGTSPLFTALAIFIYLLEVLVAFIQAYIFTTLTAVFIGQAREGGHDNDHGDGHADDVMI